MYYRRDCLLTRNLEKFLDTQELMCTQLIRSLDTMLSELPTVEQVESFRSLYDWNVSLDGAEQPVPSSPSAPAAAASSAIPGRQRNASANARANDYNAY